MTAYIAIGYEPGGQTNNPYSLLVVVTSSLAGGKKINKFIDKPYPNSFTAKCLLYYFVYPSSFSFKSHTYSISISPTSISSLSSEFSIRMDQLARKRPLPVLEKANHVQWFKLALLHFQAEGIEHVLNQKMEDFVLVVEIGRAHV